MSEPIKTRRIRVTRACGHKTDIMVIERGWRTDEYIRELRHTKCDDCLKRGYPDIDIKAPTIRSYSFVPMAPGPSGPWRDWPTNPEPETELPEPEADDFDLGEFLEEME